MIESPSNPLVRSLRNLATSKGRRESGLFLVEGVRVVEDALSSGSKPSILLYNTELLTRNSRGAGLREKIERIRDGQVQEANLRAIAAAAQTEQPQGIVAAFPLPEWPSAALTAGPGLVLVCDGISDPGNMGTLLRTSEAAGVTAVLAAEGCVDVFNPKVVRAGMGVHFRLPVVQNLGWDAVEERISEASVNAARIFCTDAGATLPYDEVDWRTTAALIISSEAHGPSREAQTLCRRGGGAITIPMQGSTESLNAAIAASIVLFEAARQRRQAARGTGEETS